MIAALIPLSFIPRIPVGAQLNDFFNWLTDHLQGFFTFVSNLGDSVTNGLINWLWAPSPVLLAVIFALIGLLVRGWKFGIGALLGMFFIISMAQWDTSMQTLALVLVAAGVSVVVGVPLGVLAARSQRASAVLKPVMDLMQTMPAMVWLVPVVTLLSIGVVPGVVATIIFALPPSVRFTELGIRNVDEEIVEAANAFGATPRQTLFGVQIPLAIPTIMAGINQVIMLALSMAVIAGLVGAEGLGGQVTEAIARLDLGLGFEAGLSVVVLAIYLDRVTNAIGQGSPGSLISIWRRRWGRVGGEEPIDDDAAGQGQEGPVVRDTHTKISA